ncbi:MAG TPA: hypothetical protein VN428_13785 [Bryobacteraceae bacterium]|nr:hypothetical protein [Bryobacteraceae bacterium]
MNRRDLLKLSALLPSIGHTQERTVSMRLAFDRSLGPARMERIGLGQGGLSVEPMWDDRAKEIRALRPAMIRLFVQEYFDLLPTPGRYHFDALDRSVDLIRSTGATPLLSIAIKPKVLFPQVDQNIVEPKDYAAWEELIYRTVRHYKERGSEVGYWEVANEPDIGEDGGCPYRFKPDSYVRYYEHTVRAVRRADPRARVGGPALANVRSAIMPALLDACQSRGIPIDFVSWHIYSSEPRRIRETIEYAKELVRKFPSLELETHLNEWNMSLSNPVLDPRFQPCYVAETAWQMKDAGLDWSCYYHIRDYYVDREQFARFMSPKGAAFMARWWNRMPQFDGLFDYQNTVRPAYWTFKLLSRLTGERFEAKSRDGAVHGFLTWDPAYELYNLLIWNFSPSPAQVEIAWSGLPYNAMAKRVSLDAETGSNVENERLRPRPPLKMTAGAGRGAAQLGPYGIEFWYVEKLGR